jgi:hypothetical protein
LQVIYIKPNIVTTVTERRLIWAGHLERMSDDKTIKKVFQRKPGKRARRPKLSWLDYTENDLKSMGVKRWRKNPEDRFVWAVVLKEALVKPTAQ